MHSVTLENPKPYTDPKTACFGMFVPCIPIITPSDTSLVTMVKKTLVRLMSVICLSGIPSVTVQDLSVGSPPQVRYP